MNLYGTTIVGFLVVIVWQLHEIIQGIARLRGEIRGLSKPVTSGPSN